MSDNRSGGSAPTVLRIVLGKRLRTLREQAGVSFEDAARVIDVTPLTVRRIEKAEVGLRIPYVRELLHTYGVPATEIDDFLALAREANQPGWWYKYRDVLPEWFKAYVSLESEASVIRLYEPHYVPGLLQTHDYTTALMRVGFPASRRRRSAAECPCASGARTSSPNRTPRPSGPSWTRRCCAGPSAGPR